MVHPYYAGSPVRFEELSSFLSGILPSSTHFSGDHSVFSSFSEVVEDVVGSLQNLLQDSGLSKRQNERARLPAWPSQASWRGVARKKPGISPETRAEESEENYSYLKNVHLQLN